MIVKQSGSAKTVATLLDAAERLFSEHGYDGVGMRMLAREAAVNLSAATYHFGSKKALYLETILRRFRAVHDERLRLLALLALEGAENSPSVEQLLDCLMRPSFEAGLAHPAFNQLLARTLVSPPLFLDEVLRRELEPNLAVFVQALHRALPEMPIEVLRLRVVLSLGSMAMFSMQIAKFKYARDPAREDVVLRELVRFTASGLVSQPAVQSGDLAMLRPPKSIARKKRS